MAIIGPLKKAFNWETAHQHIPQAVVKVEPASDIYIKTVEGNSSVSKTLIVDLGYVDSNSITAIQFHLVNPGKQLIGDRIILVSQPDTTAANIQYCYDASDFYVSTCGNPESPPCITFGDGSAERDVTIFTYDGAKFCCTFDNC